MKQYRGGGTKQHNCADVICTFSPSPFVPPAAASEHGSNPLCDNQRPLFIFFYLLSPGEISHFSLRSAKRGRGCEREPQLEVTKLAVPSRRSHAPLLPGTTVFHTHFPSMESALQGGPYSHGLRYVDISSVMY